MPFVGWTFLFSKIARMVGNGISDLSQGPMSRVWATPTMMFDGDDTNFVGGHPDSLGPLFELAGTTGILRVGASLLTLG